MALNVTAQARAGFENHHHGANPHYRSSPNWAAWQIGRWAETTGRPNPNLVQRSRGSTFRVNDMMVKVDQDGTVTRLT